MFYCVSDLHEQFSFLFTREPSKVELVTFVTQKAFQRIQALASVNHVAATGGVVTVDTGFAVVDFESFWGKDCHNKLLLVPILYSSIIPLPPQICTIFVIYFT